ncbi:angiopoietin-related protein 2-like [Saccostrea cucullata]|uniref:angiopoietin-related protein 2-like n=1 Tax=Saccostrea cuccullata TaxID=36930 RepID=UPI002ED1B71F
MTTFAQNSTSSSSNTSANSQNSTMYVEALTSSVQSTSTSSEGILMNQSTTTQLVMENVSEIQSTEDALYSDTVTIQSTIPPTDNSSSNNNQTALTTLGHLSTTSEGILLNQSTTSELATENVSETHSTEGAPYNDTATMMSTIQPTDNITSNNNQTALTTLDNSSTTSQGILLNQSTTTELAMENVSEIQSTEAALYTDTVTIQSISNNQSTLTTLDNFSILPTNQTTNLETTVLAESTTGVNTVPNSTTKYLSTVQSTPESTEPNCMDCDCWSLRGMTGKLTIFLAGQFIEVNCTEDGTLYHWTTFQRRINGTVNFYRNWSDYENGFGSIDDEFWLGNKYIHELTRLGHTYLGIDLLTFEGRLLSIEYATFRVGNSSTKYILEVGNPVYTSTPEWDIGDSMANHNGMLFTTYDADNDENKAKNNGNCAIILRGGWWYKNCGDCNLNGEYSHERYPPDDRVYWKDYGGFQESLKEVTMKIRKP